MELKQVLLVIAAILITVFAAHAACIDIYTDGVIVAPDFKYSNTLSAHNLPQSSQISFNANINNPFMPYPSGDNSDMLAAQNIKTISHRGLSTEAPENTLSAFLLAKINGFNYVECDISYTCDNRVVLIHDSTIDRTSNGSGKVCSMTLDELRKYDFGSWKSEAYTGTPIPTLEEFLVLCKKTGLMPYIDLKDTESFTDKQIQNVVNIVDRYGMLRKTTFISFSDKYLNVIKDYDETVRIGLLVKQITEEAVKNAASLRTGNNEVFLNACAGYITSDSICSAINNSLPVEIWTIQSKDQALSVNPYVTGITSDIADVADISKKPVIYFR